MAPPVSNSFLSPNSTYQTRYCPAEITKCITTRSEGEIKAGRAEGIVPGRGKGKCKGHEMHLAEVTRVVEGVSEEGRGQTRADRNQGLIMEVVGSPR